jgi:hypothetical protein
MLNFQYDDLAVASDLAGADFAGVDFASAPGADLSAATPPDMAIPPGSDLAGVDLTPNTPTTPDTCAQALALTAPTMLMDEDTSALADDFHFGNNTSAACSAAVGGAIPYAGPDAVYKIDVPAGKTLSVTLLHHNLPNTWDSALALVTDCAHPDTSCVAARDDFHTFSANEDAMWTNGGGATQTVYIIVDSSNATSGGGVDPGGTFDLTVSVN